MSDDVLSEDIAALNRQFLNLVARHAGMAETLCLRLNISGDFLSKVASISSGDLERVAALGTCLLQPLIDGETLQNAAKLTPEQGQAHIRSAARLKQVIGR
jgi:hypothetical protein